MHQHVAELAGRVLSGRQLYRDDAVRLARLEDEYLWDLLYWANRIRLRFVGPRVSLCAIAPARIGGCTEDCRFCAQSARYHTPLPARRRLTDEEIISAARRATADGAGSFGLVASGRRLSPSELRDWLGPLLRRLSAEMTIRLCASVGGLDRDSAAFLRDCGVRRINHNIETSERHYPNIVTTHTFAERLATLDAAREAGLSLCCGGIFGIGETWDDRIDMLLTLRRINPDVVPVNFLNAIPGTPLEHTPRLPPLECLRIIAICRFVLPDREIKVAGGREVCLRDLQSWMFHAGASSTMIGNYLTTAGRPPEQDLQMLADLGLTRTPTSLPARTPEGARSQHDGPAQGATAAPTDARTGPCGAP